MEDPAIVRRIAWRQVFPWLLVFRSFRLSISMPLLLLATAGTLLTPLGWRVADWLFVDDELRASSGFGEYVEFHSRWPLTLSDDAMGVAAPTTPSATTAVARATANMVDVYWLYTEPFQRFFARRLRVTQCAYLLFGGLWNVAIWSLVAGAITRVAAVQLGREERLGWREAVRHACRNFGWYFFSPLFPLLGVVLLVIPIVLLGLLMRLDVGALAAGILWPVALILALPAVAMLLGLLFGWPLMWPTISSEEGSDAFEAFSRSYSYTFQRPLHYLFYAGLTVAFGSLCWLLVFHFAGAVVDLSLWSAAWGSGGQRLSDVLASREGTVVAAGSALLQLFHQLVHTIAIAFNFSFFWCAATAIYLLLRRDVDQTEFDEVFVEDEEDRYGLPPLEPAPAEQPTAVANQPAEVAAAEGRPADKPEQDQ